jgi:hypothetical protein
MLLWVVLVFLVTLFFSLYKDRFTQEGFTPMQDELSIPSSFPNMKVKELQELMDAGVLWKDVEPSRMQDLLIVLDQADFKKVLEGNNPYLNKPGDARTKELGECFLDLFRVKFYEDYQTLVDLFTSIDRTSGTTYTAKNTTLQEKYQYYINFDISNQSSSIQSSIKLLKDGINIPFDNAKISYTRLIDFYKSGFKKVDNRVVKTNYNINMIAGSWDNSSFITDYKALVLRVLQKRMLEQRNRDSTNALEFAKNNSSSYPPSPSLSFFATIMDKLNILEKKDIAPVLTNKPVEVMAIDRYLEPSCEEGESLFCSGQIRCTDIYGNDIPNLMKTDENSSYTNGKTYSNCGSYTNRVEYKDWIQSFSKNLLSEATEIIAYDTTNCTITKPWRLANTSCYMSVEKAQEAFLKTHIPNNELLIGSIVLLEVSFLDDFFSRNAESIFNLNRPTENIQTRRLKYKGNMVSQNTKNDKINKFSETDQDIDKLKNLPKVWVNQTTYYKGKIIQITKEGYDLIIPDDYGIKITGIKKENIFMPNVSYLNILNETLTDATVNSLPRPMCSGYFSKCSKKPKIVFDPSDTLKKDLIHLYEKSSPYLLTSTEVSDSCPSTDTIGFSLF